MSLTHNFTEKEYEQRSTKYLRTIKRAVIVIALYTRLQHISVLWLDL